MTTIKDQIFTHVDDDDKNPWSPVFNKSIIVYYDNHNFNRNAT